MTNLPKSHKLSDSMFEKRVTLLWTFLQRVSGYLDRVSVISNWVSSPTLAFKASSATFSALPRVVDNDHISTLRLGDCGRSRSDQKAYKSSHERERRGISGSPEVFGVQKVEMTRALPKDPGTHCKEVQRRIYTRSAGSTPEGGDDTSPAQESWNTLQRGPAKYLHQKVEMTRALPKDPGTHCKEVQRRIYTRWWR
ncbi:hypothetical protein LAZ67_12001991 [Cordylochernes scorpioides]|uniref:Uncharacterized protein n=1 Tax=Cordylochernes scorpioides TaxID=51811 RepID=A0ABY6L5G2_9ARAC|nr:hypothetical protein LAZ67_12001991 [Cordylochernes scorpioides]